MVTPVLERLDYLHFLSGDSNVRRATSVGCPRQVSARREIESDESSSDRLRRRAARQRCRAGSIREAARARICSKYVLTVYRMLQKQTKCAVYCPLGNSKYNTHYPRPGKK